MLTTDEYKQAERKYTRAEAKRGWRIHAAVYAVVMSGLIVLNVMLIAFTEGDFPWVIFPLVCWGIGLTFHYVYGVRRGETAVRTRQDAIETYARRIGKAT